MDAVTLIDEHLDIDRLLFHYNFEKIHSDSEIIRACCKLHGGNDPSAFVISRETGLWYCHTGCGKGGDAYTLVQHFEECDFIGSVNWLADFCGIDISNMQVIERKKDYVKELKKFIAMMKKRKTVKLKPFTIDEPIKEVIKYRKFKKETLKHFKLGYVEQIRLKNRKGDDYTLRNRLIFPIYFKGIQIGLSLRRTNSKDVPRWSHQPVDIETGDYLYNYDAITPETEYVVVVEGLSDVWALYEIGVIAVATFGAHLTDMQYKLLLKSGCPNIILAYDGDEAGRNATKKALSMLKHKANLWQIMFNEGEDPESITREELDGRFKTRKKL